MIIINSIRSRLKGGLLYDSLKRSLQIRGDRKCPLEKALKKRRIVSLKNYFLTGLIMKRINREYQQGIYSALCSLYTDSLDCTLFNFSGIRIPKPIEKINQELFVDEVQDFLIYYLLEDTAFCDAVTQEGPYELQSVRISNGDAVIDCGANIGLFSAIASKKASVVYAFEPSQNVIDKHLSKTAELNSKIYVVPKGISEKSGEATWKESTNNIHSSKISHFGMVAGEGERISTISLDEFVNDKKLESIDFIKADIEGAERYMLKGAKNVLKEFAPKLAICTYHLPDDKKILQDLVLDANPQYVIEHKFMKMYAYVPR